MIKMIDIIFKYYHTSEMKLNPRRKLPKLYSTSDVIDNERKVKTPFKLETINNQYNVGSKVMQNVAEYSHNITDQFDKMAEIQHTFG